MVQEIQKTATELEASITIKLLERIETALESDKGKNTEGFLGTSISHYGDFQAAAYRRAYIGQIGKLPPSSTSNQP